uniref:Uncharacterized protein n=1 Tax=Lactuca sativa TaxID=4236 RepID=A0A9R1WXM7_LACSA|nr:hypothetical protein LSAT_V11C800423080 [Lactuca sativa]
MNSDSGGGQRSKVLTEWPEKVVRKNEERTTGWSVSGVSDAIYQVHDFKHGGIVDLRQELVHENIGNELGCIVEAIYPLPEPCDWGIPNEMMVVKPPIMDTRQAGRPKNRNCIPPQGEEPIVRRCSICDSTTYNATTCPTFVPMKQNKSRKSNSASCSNTKRKGKGMQRTQGTHETLDTDGTQETRRTQGT